MGVPLLLTVAIEENAFQFFNALRKIYFPQEPGAMAAHIHLFHQLPTAGFIESDIEEAANSHAVFTIEVKEPVSVGNAVLYRLQSPELVQIHGQLQKKWKDLLVPEDIKELDPQIVIQERASEEESAELLIFLKQQFSSFPIKATALQLWAFDPGSWKLQCQFPFRSN
jgi:hypothetical protein